MPRPASRSRALIATLGVILGSGAVIAVHPALAFQAGSGRGGGSAAGGPLNLLSPTFIAPAPRTAVPRGAEAAPNVQVTPAAPAMMAAPVPAPRPASAPRAVIELVDRDESVKGKDDKARHEEMLKAQESA